MAQNENYSQVDLRVGTEEQFNAKVGTLPAGTLFGITDSTVSKADLSTDLKNEINGKINKPANPTSDSAITINSSGTISTKPLSDIAGKSEVAVQSTTPTGDEILWINPNGTGGGGSGGGGKLYRHNIMINNFVQVSSFNCPAYLEIYLTEGTEFTTFSALWEAMKRPSNLFVKIFYQNYIGNCFMAIGGSPSSVILRGSVPTSNNNIELMPSPMQDYASKNIVDTVTEL